MTGRETHRAVVLQRCFHTVELGGQGVIVLGHQHDAIKAERKEEIVINHQHRATKKEACNISPDAHFWFLRSDVHSTGCTLQRQT